MFAPLPLSAVAMRLLDPARGPLEQPIRGVLHGAGGLAEHGGALAGLHDIAASRVPKQSFFPRLRENVDVLGQACALLDEHATQGHHLAPAAGWLIDNVTLLEQQLDTVRDGLPLHYFEKLPRLRGAPLAGLPRVYGIAWEWVSHTDSGLDEGLLETFLTAYQSGCELTLGELWAIPTTLRVVLVENLRRLAERAAAVQAARDAAHRWVELPATPDAMAVLDRIAELLRRRDVFDPFALQLWRRADESTAPAGLRAWLTEHLSDGAAALERQQHLAAEDHHSVRNAVTALRMIDRVDWRGIFMRTNRVLREMQRLPVFVEESDETQDLSLRRIEAIARRLGLAESRIALAVVERAAGAAGPEAAPLYWLQGAGEARLHLDLVRRARARVRWALPLRHALAPAYVGAIALATAALVAFALPAVEVPHWALAISALLLSVPLSEAVVAAVNRLISESVPPRQIPRLALADGIPAERRALVVIPALLTRPELAEVLAAQLEGHWIANPEVHAQFALLSDWPDAPQPQQPGDAAALAAAQAAIERLNRRYPVAPGAPQRFLLLHRERRWCDSEQAWMGWERKRGKLEQLIAWLAAGGSAPFIDFGAMSRPAPGVVSVVTLDSDTEMPPGRLRELAGVAAHPLNRPQVGPDGRRLVSGAAIVQPRIAVPLPAPGDVTPYYWLFSGRWGVDPYSVPSSEIYEDVFAEGTFAGKGLLDVAAVHALLSQRLPESQVLSHDLLEGALAGCIAANEITLIEDAPADPDVAAARLHRWMRGDWQLLPFLLRPRRWPMAGIQRWKMFDNLRRSLVAPASLLLLLWAMVDDVLPMATAFWAVVAAYAAGPLLGALAALAPTRDDIDPGPFFRASLEGLVRALAGVAWHVAQLGAQAVLAADAVGRALLRQLVTRRRLLEWTTAAASAAATRSDLPSLWRRHRLVSGLMLAILAALLLAQPARGVHVGWAVALCALWAAAPLTIWFASRRRPASPDRLDEGDRDMLRALAADTWRFYARHVGAEDNDLPPDNVQLVPETMVAHRTSPTNIGLYLLVVVAARELGLIGVTDLVRRLERTLATLDRLGRWHGHFYNWYETRTLETLAPAYVSAVDSGNLSGHLLVVAAACEELAARASWDEVPQAAFVASARRVRPLARGVKEFPALVSLAQTGQADIADATCLRIRIAEARRELGALTQGLGILDSSVPVRRLLDHLELLDAWQRDRTADASPLRQQLRRLAAHCHSLALAPDFGALYDRRARLLRIGYRASSEELDDAHYDLLASEARLASLVGIAKGDLPPRHWATLGRPFFAGADGVGLKSWSGSMFEYLMPSLVLEEPVGSALHAAARCAVAEQRLEARAHATPWGISESAIAVQDHTLAYQYGPQGVARLALRRTPPDERVIAPYATMLALPVAPRAAVENLRALEALGVRRSLGFIEALDYTARRQPAEPTGRNETFAPVETFMAHHQAMGLLACFQVLTDGALHRWARRDAHLRAVRALLHEPVPREARRPRGREAVGPTSALRQRWLHRCDPRTTAVPPMHLLGNGRYTVALRATGAGHSRWQDHGLTRWRDDVLRDASGFFAYVRRANDPRWLSLSARPAPDDAARYDAEFQPDRVLLHADWPDLQATTTVTVSTEDDCELRRIDIHNPGRKPLVLTIATAFEVTLAPPAADEAHPAFSNLFVDARWSAAQCAMFLRRKPRAAGDAEIHAVHFIAASDDEAAPVQPCADRRRWLGRLGSVDEPAVVPGELESPPDGPLPTGLDPVSVLLSRMLVPPGTTRSLTVALGCAADPVTLHALVDRYRQAAGTRRALGLSDTLARIRLRELRLDPDSWAAWLQLNTLIVNLMTRPLTQVPAGVDRRVLWRHGISGDRPIVVLWIEGVDGIAIARQTVSLLPLWTVAGAPLDLVLVNGEAPSYLAPVQQAFAQLADLASLRLDPQVPKERRAALVLLQARDLPEAELAALRVFARVMLQADGRSLAQHLERLRIAHDEAFVARSRTEQLRPAWPRPRADARAPEGDFDAETAAFRFSCTPTRYPARPWINVLANRDFGCQVSENGAGFTWAGNSRMHQITAWTNDALCDLPNEALMLEDLDRAEVWLLGRELNEAGRAVEHGIGFTRIRCAVADLDIELSWTVDAVHAVKQVQVRLAAAAAQPRRLRLVAFAEWTLGAARRERASVVTRAERGEDGVLRLTATQLDAAGGSGGATAFIGWRNADAPPPDATEDWTCDRREFFDTAGSWVLPRRLGARAGAGLDACAAVGTRVDLSPGAGPVHATLLLGHAAGVAEARALAREVWQVEPQQRLREQVASWPALFDRVRVRTPDPRFDALVNRWLPYQAVACRLWARAGFYQASGAFGFRDQLQDAMGLADRAPQLLRAQILLNASRQFVEGDVQHWWHMPTGAGVRTHVSDSLLWLPLAAAHLVTRSGDASVLDEPVGFLRGPPIPEGHDDLYSVPEVADERASVYEHAARALDRGLRLGAHGLPLMGSGDWNDGMNRVGAGGRGESVWLAWFLCHVIDGFAPIAERRGDGVRAARWRTARATITTALDRDGWDGAWYRRAFFDDGTPLGSAHNPECRIDLIAQAWAVLSGAGDPARAVTALRSGQAHLWDAESHVLKLLDPPLAHARPDAGYIQGYPPGIRENGGQYNHGAVWALMAHAATGDAATAWRIFNAISPAHRSADSEVGKRYELEPYVTAGDIYSQPPYAGRGGWSWYSGSAAWLQRAALESICGLRLEGARLALRPCLPAHWRRVEIELREAGRTVMIEIVRGAAEGAHVIGTGEWVDLRPLPDGTRLQVQLPS
jgi:cyclic beta-1,2-glucan synthetase